MSMNNELLGRFSDYVTRKSVNSLKSLEPEKIKDIIKGTDSETVELIRQLVDERLLTPKYVFDCECGCRCSVYERILSEEKSFCCKECFTIYLVFFYYPMDYSIIFSIVFYNISNFDVI